MFVVLAAVVSGASCCYLQGCSSPLTFWFRILHHQHLKRFLFIFHRVIPFLDYVHMPLCVCCVLCVA